MSLRHVLTRLAYRSYRRLKTFMLVRRPPGVGRLFSLANRALGIVLSQRKTSPLLETERRLWKIMYQMRFGGAPSALVKAAVPVATDSADHKWPHGTIRDNSTNRNFNVKLYHCFGYRPDLRVLDLGCSGGGFVKSVIEDGYSAIGLEGSDISKRLRSGEWDTIPGHLFTCDISANFRIESPGGERMRFHCITAWEVLEHIPEDKLATLFANIRESLEPDGIFVGSVACFPDGDIVAGAIYHVTLHDAPWWHERFARAGLVPVAGHPFETRDYVRGHGMGLKDWDPADGDGFHVVMRHAAANRAS